MLAPHLLHKGEEFAQPASHLVIEVGGTNNEFEVDQ
jgi:hypothetical protein